jgi:uncharacterized protein
MTGFVKGKEDVFHNRIAQQASLAVEGLALLCKYVEAPSPEAAAKILLKEKEADEVRRILIDDLNHTFNTPFDREDILTLSYIIDDMPDYTHSTVDEMKVPNIKTTKYNQRIASLLDKAANVIADIVVKRA